MKETGLRQYTIIRCILLKKQFRDLSSKKTVYFPTGHPRRAIARTRHGIRMTDQPASGDSGNRTVVANYVAAMSADLANMARRSGLDTLGYLLEMVRLEAENVTRHKQNGGS